MSEEKKFEKRYVGFLGSILCSVQGDIAWKRKKDAVSHGASLKTECKPCGLCENCKVIALPIDIEKGSSKVRHIGYCGFEGTRDYCHIEGTKAWLTKTSAILDARLLKKGCEIVRNKSCRKCKPMSYAIEIEK